MWSPWEPMGAHGQPMEAHGVAIGGHGQSIGAPWAIHQGPTGAHGFHWDPLGAHGEAICRPMGRQWGAMGAHGGHYINKLPINRPSGRHLGVQYSDLTDSQIRHGLVLKATVPNPISQQVRSGSPT